MPSAARANWNVATDNAATAVSTTTNLNGNDAGNHQLYRQRQPHHADATTAHVSTSHRATPK